MANFGVLNPKLLGAVTAPSSIRLATPTTLTTEATSGVYPTPWGAKQAIPLPSLGAVIFTHGVEAMRYAFAGATYRLGLLAPPAGFTVTPTAARATATVTFTADTRPANGDKFYMTNPYAGPMSGGGTITSWYVKFMDTLPTPGSGDDYTIHIKRSATAGAAGLAATIASLNAFFAKTAVNGTDYAVEGHTMADVVDSFDVSISSTTATVVTFRYDVYGAAGNDLTITEVIDSGGSWVPTNFSGGSSGTGTSPSTGTFTYAQATLRRDDSALSAIAIPDVDITQESEGQVNLASFATLVARDATDYRRWYRTLAGGRRFFKGDDVTGTSDSDAISDDTLADETNRYEYDERIFRPRAAGYPVVGRYGVMWRGSLWIGGALKNADYTAGTAAVTLDSASVTMSALCRVKEDVIGMWLRIPSHTIDYLIIGCDPSTRVLTLARTFAGTTAAASTYTITDLRDPFALYRSVATLVNNWPATNSLLGVTSSNPDGITGLAVIQDSLVVFTKTGLWRVVGNTGAFRLQNIAEGCGCFSGQSIQSDGEAIYWLGPGGVFRWAGGDVLPIPLSKPNTDDPEGIQGTIEQINGDEADIICSNYNATTHKIRWWVPLGTSTSNQDCIRYDLHTRSFGLHSANGVTAAWTVPGPAGTLVTVTGCEDGTLWQLDLGYSDGAWGFEPVQSFSSWAVVTRTLTVTGTALPTSGDGLIGVQGIILNKTTGAYENVKVASNTSSAVVLAEPPTMTPAAGCVLILGGIPLDVRATRFDWSQPYLDKWLEAATLAHEVEVGATEVWVGAGSDDGDAEVFVPHGAAEADVCLMTETDGEHHFWLYTARGKTLSYRILAIGRGYRVRLRSLVLSVRSPVLDEVEG